MEDSYDMGVYRLRCASPMPIYGQGGFVLHTFGVEYLINRIYRCTSTLPNSRQFRGQGGDLMSGSFSRLSANEEMYQGKVVVDPGINNRFLDEDAVPFKMF